VDFSSRSIGDWSGDIANWEESVDEVKFDTELVTRKLKLNPGISPGPDGIHPMLLKNCADELSTPLSLLFKWSCEQGQLPNDWKNAHITSIYKKGDKSDAGNYRPVSLTSVVCKVMESLLKDYMLLTLANTGKLTKYQYGFTRGRSCSTNLLETFESWTRLLDAGIGINVIYLDYKKAFDKVPHQRLLRKLKSFGIGGRLLKWIEAFLINRKMMTMAMAQIGWKC
jgi:Reverse transcriptase (RNA-dependent DNA polymerase)